MLTDNNEFNVADPSRIFPETGYIPSLTEGITEMAEAEDLKDLPHLSSAGPKLRVDELDQ